MIAHDTHTHTPRTEWRPYNTNVKNRNAKKHTHTKRLNIITMLHVKISSYVWIFALKMCEMLCFHSSIAIYWHFFVLLLCRSYWRKRVFSSFRKMQMWCWFWLWFLHMHRTATDTEHFPSPSIFMTLSLLIPIGMDFPPKFFSVVVGAILVHCGYGRWMLLLHVHPMLFRERTLAHTAKYGWLL